MPTKEPSGTLTITENGEYNISGYESVVVNVEAATTRLDDEEEDDESSD